jgi:hypothetical protein
MREVYPTVSAKYLGRLMGGMDHTTVLHHIKQVRDYMSVYPEWRMRVDQLVNELKMQSGEQKAMFPKATHTRPDTSAAGAA